MSQPLAQQRALTLAQAPVELCYPLSSLLAGSMMFQIHRAEILIGRIDSNGSVRQPGPRNHTRSILTPQSAGLDKVAHHCEVTSREPRRDPFAIGLSFIFRHARRSGSHPRHRNQKTLPSRLDD